MEPRTSKLLRLGAAALLLLAIADLPYGYYTFLRWAIAILSGFVAFQSYENDATGMAMVFAIVAILFNPVVPIYFDKDTWIVIDLVVGILLLVSVFIRATHTIEDDEHHNLDGRFGRMTTTKKRSFAPLQPELRMSANCDRATGRLSVPRLVTGVDQAYLMRILCEPGMSILEGDPILSFRTTTRYGSVLSPIAGIVDRVFDAGVHELSVGDPIVDLSTKAHSPQDSLSRRSKESGKPWKQESQISIVPILAAIDWEMTPDELLDALPSSNVLPRHPTMSAFGVELRIRGIPSAVIGYFRNGRLDRLNVMLYDSFPGIEALHSTANSIVNEVSEVWGRPSTQHEQLTRWVRRQIVITVAVTRSDDGDHQLGVTVTNPRTDLTISKPRR